MLTEPIQQHDMWIAYQHWLKFCDEHFGGHSLEQTPLFEAFIGYNFNWMRTVNWCPPEVANRVRLLMSPHYRSLMKAYYIQLDDKERRVEVS